MNEIRKGGTAAIILAGGFGRRLKSIGPKPFLECNGESFIELAVHNVVETKIDSVIIVTNIQFENRIRQLKLRAKIVVNKYPENGMLSSILVGMELLASGCSGFLLCPVDYPLIKIATFRQILQAHHDHPSFITKPVYQGRSGHPIIIPQNLFSELYRIPENQGARYLLQKHSAFVNDIPVEDPGILININTPALFNQYCK